MSRKIHDLIGQRFGKLLVLHQAERRKGRIAWTCQCDCGNIKDILSFRLTLGRSASCGCQIGHGRGKPLSNFERSLGHYQRSAETRNRKWELSLDQFRSLINTECFYCGHPPDNWLGFNGIDRVNNDQGYTLINCVSCCSTCNYAKAKKSVSEFAEWVSRAYDHLSVKGLI